MSIQFNMQNRILSIDALRGFAIITMILSGQMVTKFLPAWMCHAQVPPPDHIFDPTIFGITWVDLVFPFFLFSMGASMSFSLGNALAKGTNKWQLVYKSFLRALKLIYFAIFFQHAKPFVISNPMTVFSCCIALFAFVLMFFMFMDIRITLSKNNTTNKYISSLIKAVAYSIGFAMIYSLEYTGKSSSTFDFNYSDIIIIVLANMGFFASVAYIFTYKKTTYRILILPFIMAVFLASTAEGWVKNLYDFTPVSWAYSFYYLKYLFIVIPGTLAGDFIAEYKTVNRLDSEIKKLKPILIITLSTILIISNVTLLFARMVGFNVLLTSILLLLIYTITKTGESTFENLWRKLSNTGSYLLLLGLCFEGYQGGIRKDDSTYSYYFVTAGLSFFALLILSIGFDYYKKSKTNFLLLTGQNPMIAYVTTALIISPIITLCQLDSYFTIFNQNALLGITRGILFTTISIIITMYFSKLKWFWRT
jgi:predicted acyltransferase